MPEAHLCIAAKRGMSLGGMIGEELTDHLLNPITVIPHNHFQGLIKA